MSRPLPIAQPPFALLLGLLLPLLLLVAGCGTPLHSAQPAATVLAPVPPAQPEAASAITAKPGWRFQRQAVAAAHPLAAEAGHAMLRQGGSAMDAAIAAQWVLGLVEPQSSGLGGGAFLLHFDGQQVRAYDGRETAPAAATPGQFLQPDGAPLPFMEAVNSGLSVGVPGAVRMLELAHQRHGRLPWPQLFEPAIALAEQGFPVGDRLHTLLKEDRLLRQNPGAAAYFYDASGAPWPVGHHLKNPAMAEVLRALARQGSSALYEGPIAQDLVRAVQNHPQRPGLLSEADLRAYRAVEREALCHTLEVLRLCGFPPPSSGALAVGQILGLLGPHRTGIAGAKPLDATGAPRPEWLHRYTEASRLAFADRALYVADPAFVRPPGGSWLSLLDPAYLNRRAGLIGQQAMPEAPAGAPADSFAEAAWAPMPPQPSTGTSHISVQDAQGHAVSLTTTIENAFGSRIWVRGFLLNNQLTDFSLLPADEAGRPVANRVEAGKRPRSSMSPTLVFHEPSGELLLNVGSPGGAFIIHFVSKALLANLWWGLDIQRAIDVPNFGTLGVQPAAQGTRTAPLLLERGRFPSATLEALRQRGHEVREVPLPSGLQGLERRDGAYFGGADPRREGVVLAD